MNDCPRRIWSALSPALLLALLFNLQAKAGTMSTSLAEDMQTIRKRVLAPLLRAPDPRSARDLFAALSPEGTWPDVDYADADRAVWKTSRHLNHLYLLTRAYAVPESPLYHSPELRRPLFAALDHWLENDYTNPNWWYNQIGVPRTLAPILLLLEEELSPQQLEGGLRILARAELGMTGQNLVWVSEITALRGLLEDDPDLIREAFSRISDEIRLTEEEGIQPDFSFHQHGDCLYSHGYGAGFASDGARIAALLSGTGLAFPREKVDLLTSLVLDGHQWFTRGIWQDFGAIGREISRSGHTARYLRSVVDHLLQLPTGREEELRALAARLRDDDAPALTGNRHFWHSDVMTHHRPDWYASARIFSDRMLNTDFPCNEEGLQSHHIADGATCLLRTGREYFDIFPVWDWQKIPGTTVVLTPELDGDVLRRGSRSFAGGVSDGVDGLAAFDFERETLRARKSWFFFDSGVACLGAGISDSSTHPVITTLNQCHLEGEVATPSGTHQSGLHTFTGPTWIHHDGIAYIFPQTADIHLETGPRTGSWQQINHSASADPVTHDTFTLWIDHGRAPQNETYAYIIAPALPLDEIDSAPSVDILANTPALQAVHYPARNLTGAAFYTPGELKLDDDLKITVDQPCLLLLRRQDGQLTLSLSNPENQPLQVKLQISAKLSGEDVTTSGDHSLVTFDLPDGVQAGQTQTKTFQID